MYFSVLKLYIDLTALKVIYEQRSEFNLLFYWLDFFRLYTEQGKVNNNKLI